MIGVERIGNHGAGQMPSIAVKDAVSGQHVRDSFENFSNDFGKI